MRVCSNHAKLVGAAMINCVVEISAWAIAVLHLLLQLLQYEDPDRERH